MAKQRTIKDSFTLSGKGLHTGLNLTVEFCPAPENYGYKIQRTDMEGQPIIDCNADLVISNWYDENIQVSSSEKLKFFKISCL